MKTFRAKTAVMVCASILINLFCFNVSLAQGKLKMDEYVQEFFTGETVFSQEKHEMQFTLMPVFEKGEYRRLSIPLSVEYGITDRLQAEIETPYLISSISEQHSISGMGNTEIGLLYNIIKRNHPFSLSIGAAAPLRTSGKQIRAYDPQTSWEALAVVGRQIGPAQIHASLISEFPEGEVVLNYAVASIINFGRCSATLEFIISMENPSILTPSRQGKVGK